MTKRPDVDGKPSTFGHGLCISWRSNVVLDVLAEGCLGLRIACRCLTLGPASMVTILRLRVLEI